MEAPHPPHPHDARPVTTTTGPAHGTGTARSYDCTFCKRGFSNAQALGGHMNIHRNDRDRDRANSKPKHHPFINIIAPNKVPDLQLQYYPPDVTSTYLPSLTPRVEFRNNPSTSSTAIEEGGEELDLELRLGFVGDELEG